MLLAEKIELKGFGEEGISLIFNDLDGKIFAYGNLSYKSYCF
jgi:hypothetical protein